MVYRLCLEIGLRVRQHVFAKSISHHQRLYASKRSLDFSVECRAVSVVRLATNITVNYALVFDVSAMSTTHLLESPHVSSKFLAP